ncbi:putative oxidoreductase [Parafrankia irregularis]|uniref:Putative oxidoreductase n=1 Tax=Parafrankia irregularis TaxID=795642 RepID=A0A0S4QQF5_9ACTN|nr:MULTISPECIES: DoxX family protein [Parafrankia]MBE3206223.1 DoxX family protein [Parafrankia sp. CH37]CUU57556.1 putative oxidoreductase [Parafrankia irregularis]
MKLLERHRTPHRPPPATSAPAAVPARTVTPGAPPGTGRIARPAAVSAADLGLLLLRLTFGLLLAGHGAQKLFGLFGGEGLSATGRGFAQLGYHPGTFFAGMAGAGEFLGGLGLAAGLLTPLAAAAVIGVMINAMIVTVPHGLWETNGGMEYPLCIAVVATAVAAIGAGRLAFDRFFRRRDGGLPEMAFAVGLGGLGAAIVLAVS